MASSGLKNVVSRVCCDVLCMSDLGELVESACLIEACVHVTSQACSNLVGDDYVFPSREKLMEYRIVVTTLITAGR